jgi:hypothetical protein
LKEIPDERRLTFANWPIEKVVEIDQLLWHQLDGGFPDHLSELDWEIGETGEAAVVEAESIVGVGKLLKELYIPPSMYGRHFVGFTATTNNFQRCIAVVGNIYLTDEGLGIFLWSS